MKGLSVIQYGLAICIKVNAINNMFGCGSDCPAALRGRIRSK